jgi:hypothetical protein
MCWNSKPPPPSGSEAGTNDAGSGTVPCTSCTVSIAPTPLFVCAHCIGGGQTETPTATGSPAGGTFTWSSGDTAIVTVAGSGSNATVTGVAAGVTTVNVSYVSGCTCNASVPVTSVLVVLQLRNSDHITPAAENSTHDAVVAAMGVDGLGPLPMGQGRADFPGTAYTAGIEVVGTISPPSATSLTFRWKRFLSRRSWNIRHDTAHHRWNVTQRSRRGFPDDDTGPATFNTPVPNANRRIYSNDGSALLPGNVAADAVGDFIYEEKDFTYRVERNLRGSWITCVEMRVGQIEKVRRIATTGTVATDWSGLENSTALRTVSATIDDAKVRGIVGGADAINIDAHAND